MLPRSQRIARADFGRAFRRHRLDAIIAPTYFRSWPINLIDGDPMFGNGVAGPSNAAGYPNLTVPAVFIGELPIGISFLGRAWDEPTLLRLGLRVRAGGAGSSHADVLGCGQRLRSR